MELDQLDFLTVAECAATMKLSKMTVYRAIHEGALKAYRPGRSFRVNKVDLVAYIESTYVEDPRSIDWEHLQDDED